MYLVGLYSMAQFAMDLRSSDGVYCHGIDAYLRRLQLYGNPG